MSIINPLPYTLVNGTTADATQVMADLNQIVANTNANGAHNGANADITALTALTTPLGEITVSQALGTNTNDNAASGNLGELIRSAVLQGAPINLSSGVGANLTSINLTGGDWDVWMNLGFIAGATNVQCNFLAGGITTTSATLPASTGENNTTVGLPTGSLIFANAGIYVIVVGPLRISLASPTTYYGVGEAIFSINTLGLFGTLQARRMR